MHTEPNHSLEPVMAGKLVEQGSETMGFGSKSLSSDLAFPHTGCVTLVKFLNLSLLSPVKTVPACQTKLVVLQRYVFLA